MVKAIFGLFIFYASFSFAAEIGGFAKDEAVMSIDAIDVMGKKENCSCDIPSTQISTEFLSWNDIPIDEAQCTAGAQSAGHHAKVRISSFAKDSSFTLERLPQPQSNAVKTTLISQPNAQYVGNGPIFMESGEPNGYIKSNGKVFSPLDCVNYRSSIQNLGKENSVFVRYHPRKIPYGQGGYTSAWKFRVVSTNFLCAQLQPQPYVSWVTSHRSEDIQTFLKANKKWEQDGEDLVDGGQIDFAIQSGPAVLRDGQNLLDGYNSATHFRSYIGVNNDGNPVVVEADGNIGSFCLGQYLKRQGIRDLLHRDSYISDAAYREINGAITGYPTTNPNSKAASVLIISH